MIDKTDNYNDEFPVASFPIFGETLWFSEILTLMCWKILSNIGGVTTFPPEADLGLLQHQDGAFFSK